MLVGFPDGGQQDRLGARHRHLVVALGEAEVPGEPAAPGVEHLGADPGPFHQRAVGVEAHDGVLVAVPLHDRPRVDRGRLPVGGAFGEQLGQGARLLAQSPHVGVVGEQLRRVEAEHRGAAGFEADDGGAAAQVVAQHADGVPQHAPGHVELAGGDPGEPAADGAFRDLDAEAGRFEHRDGGAARGRVEVFGERVGPQDDLAAFAGALGAAPFAPPGREALGGERGEFAFPRDAPGVLGGAREHGHACQRVDGARSERGAPRDQR